MPNFSVKSSNIRGITILATCVFAFSNSTALETHELLPTNKVLYLATIPFIRMPGQVLNKKDLEFASRLQPVENPQKLSAISQQVRVV